MNPIEFEKNRYATMLEAFKEKKCEIRILGQHGFILTGKFIGVRECKANELTEMAGFCTTDPIYKLCMLAEMDGIQPVWINTLLIESIDDIKFLD